MEGVGSTRVGRASARYGSTAVFNGPVRKWKKKWVHVSPSSTVKHSQSNGNNNGDSSATTSIMLCRWTPLSFADSGFSGSADDGEDGDQHQPPKRKFRYTPVAVLEEERRRASVKQVENEAKTEENVTDKSPDWFSATSANELNMIKDLKKENQDSSMGNLDLNDGSHDSVGEKEGQEKPASSVGFWAMA
ncbi:hypothetical protein PTKIN_Ptkin11bG0187500 [Pterospermum kingtungense]